MEAVKNHFTNGISKYLHFKTSLAFVPWFVQKFQTAQKNLSRCHPMFRIVPFEFLVHCNKICSAQNEKKAKTFRGKTTPRYFN
jgi:hypothetical protein